MHSFLSFIPLSFPHPLSPFLTPSPSFFQKNIHYLFFFYALKKKKDSHWPKFSSYSHIRILTFPKLVIPLQPYHPLQEGEIWPNSQAEISITFRPDEFASFSRIAYCDIVGREARLPLKIKADGIGPKCVFSFDTLNIQNVFINSSHAYEVVLKNKSSIKAIFSLTLPFSHFGPKFTFEPSTGTLQPGGVQAIQVLQRENHHQMSVCMMPHQSYYQVIWNISSFCCSQKFIKYFNMREIIFQNILIDVNILRYFNFCHLINKTDAIVSCFFNLF